MDLHHPSPALIQEFNELADTDKSAAGVTGEVCQTKQTLTKSAEM